jgi:hypothetical protein
MQLLRRKLTVLLLNRNILKNPLARLPFLSEVRSWYLAFLPIIQIFLGLNYPRFAELNYPTQIFNKLLFSSLNSLKFSMNTLGKSHSE